MHLRLTRMLAPVHGCPAPSGECWAANIQGFAGITEHSRANAKLKEGLQKLGVHYGEIPRNTSTGHSCGHCSFGCAHGEKQDGTATFLADAVQAGAKIITGVDNTFTRHCLPLASRAFLLLCALHN